MKVPHGDRVEDLVPLVPTFLSYVLSFVYVGIYWNNHHHMLHACTAVTGAMLWANLHLLFWLSLFPFTTGWMGENLSPSSLVDTIVVLFHSPLVIQISDLSYFYLRVGRLYIGLRSNKGCYLKRGATVSQSRESADPSRVTPMGVAQPAARQRSNASAHQNKADNRDAEDALFFEM